MKTVLRLFGIALLSLNAACASITAGTTQSVAISTAPTSGAQCQLSNEKGSWTIPATPGSTSVSKAYGDLTVNCKHPTAGEGATSVQSSTAGAAYGNILLG